MRLSDKAFRPLRATQAPVSVYKIHIMWERRPLLGKALVAHVLVSLTLAPCDGGHVISRLVTFCTAASDMRDRGFWCQNEVQT